MEGEKASVQADSFALVELNALLSISDSHFRCISFSLQRLFSSASLSVFSSRFVLAAVISCRLDDSWNLRVDECERVSKMELSSQ